MRGSLALPRNCLKDAGGSLPIQLWFRLACNLRVTKSSRLLWSGTFTGVCHGSWRHLPCKSEQRQGGLKCGLTQRLKTTGGWRRRLVYVWPASSQHPGSVTHSRKLRTTREEEVESIKDFFFLKNRVEQNKEVATALGQKGNWGGSHDIWFQFVCGFLWEYKCSLKYFNFLFSHFSDPKLSDNLVNS